MPSFIKNPEATLTFNYLNDCPTFVTWHRFSPRNTAEIGRGNGSCMKIVIVRRNFWALHTGQQSSRWKHNSKKLLKVFTIEIRLETKLGGKWTM